MSLQYKVTSQMGSQASLPSSHATQSSSHALRGSGIYIHVEHGNEAQVTFKQIYNAWQHCRKRKRDKPQTQLYEINLFDNIIKTVQALNDGSWMPQPSVCFMVKQPKLREIHAASFADRVVHHYITPILEELFEPMFIHDVYSNRKGKGTHKAVARTAYFMRCAHNISRSHALRGSGYSSTTNNNTLRSHAEHGNECKIPNKPKQNHPQGDATTVKSKTKGYFLQLDIINFFYTINRKILLQLIVKQLKKSVKKQHINQSTAHHYYLICKKIIQNNSWQNSRQINKNQLSKIPSHKRLVNAAPDTGLPIGNLTSQFFANVYLNQLDQFIKHNLKCQYYIRYVDDFILINQSKQQLQSWQTQITEFLAQKLKIKIKPAQVKSISNGADFLGYIIRPNYKLVRKRVIANLYEKLTQIESKIFFNIPNQDRDFRRLALRHETQHYHLNITYQQLNELQAILASYWGHFKHANHWRLQKKIINRFNWLRYLFNFNNDKLVPLWQATDAYSYITQVQYFRNQYPNAILKIQKGNYFELYSPNNKDNCSGIPLWVPAILKKYKENSIYKQFNLKQETPNKPNQNHRSGIPLWVPAILKKYKENSIYKQFNLKQETPNKPKQRHPQGVATTVQSFVKALTVIQHGYLKSGLRHRIINQMTIQL